MRRFAFVILSMSRHDHLSSASWSLARELSKHHKVFYVDQPMTLKDHLLKRNDPSTLKRRKAILSGNLTESLNENLQIIYTWPILPVNWLMKGRLYKSLLKLNDSFLYRAVKKALERKGIKKFILLNSFNPFYGDAIQQKGNPLITIYQCRDNLKAAKYVNKHGPELEKEKTRKADFVITTSVKLYDMLEPYNQNIYHLPNAVDFDMFHNAASNDFEKPSEFSNIIGNIIGYIGHIDDRVDLEITEYLLSEKPDDTIVFIGPAGIPLDRLKKYRNFMHIGFTLYESLPAYLSRFDLAIIPFLKNEFTKYIYPLKINEYLSAGKPVVSTTFSKDIQDFKGIISLADEKEAFLAAVNKGLGTDSEKKKAERIAFARKNSWTQRCETLLELIEKHLPAS